MKTLELCKQWGGPFTSVAQLEAALKGNPDKQELIVWKELVYYRDTHKSDIVASPDLFRVNAITHEERASNLCVLLGDTDYIATATSSSEIDLPTLKDLKKVSKKSSPSDECTTSNVNVNDMCILAWDIGTMTWFLGYVKEIHDDTTFTVEHLERVQKSEDVFWRYPSHDDIEVANVSQILQCAIAGEWDMEARSPTFTLRNAAEIRNTFNKLYK